MYCKSKGRCCFSLCFLETENAALEQGVTATITAADTSLLNKCVYAMGYCVCFDGATGAEALQITVGDTTYPVWDRDGVPLMIGRLRRGECLRLKYISTAPAHFTLESGLRPLCLKTPRAGV